MPNGHGVPLGCFVCSHYQKGEPNPLIGHCQHHEVEVHMNLVCADFDNAVNNASHHVPLAKDTLYAFVDVAGHGYPPPTELVPLAKILEYKEWDIRKREQAWIAARKLADELFERRK